MAEVESLFVQGQVQLSQRNAVAALHLFNQVLELTPDSALAYIGRANAYLVLGRFADAVRDLSVAIELDVGAFALRVIRSMVFIQLGQAEEALADLNQVLGVQSNDSAGLCLRGSLFWRQGRIREALRDLETSLQLWAANPIALDERGQVFSLIGQLHDAEQDFLRAVDMQPTADRHYRYGVTLSCLGHYEEALLQFNAALVLTPSLAAALTERGVVLLELGHIDAGSKDLDDAVALAPGYHIAWLNRAAYHYLRRNWLAMRVNAKRAAKLAPNESLSYKLIALAAMALGRKGEAIANLERFLELEPDSADREPLQAMLGQLREELSRKKQGWWARLLQLCRPDKPSAP